MTSNPRQLDIFLAEKLFGMKTFTHPTDPTQLILGLEGPIVFLPHYSTDATAMLTVIEKMRERGFNFSAYTALKDRFLAGFSGVTVDVRAEKFGETLPLTVALAAKAALEADKPTTREGSR